MFCKFHHLSPKGRCCSFLWCLFSDTKCDFSMSVLQFSTLLCPTIQFSLTLPGVSTELAKGSVPQNCPQVRPQMGAQQTTKSGLSMTCPPGFVTHWNNSQDRKALYSLLTSVFIKDALQGQPKGGGAWQGVWSGAPSQHLRVLPDRLLGVGEEFRWCFGTEAPRRTSSPALSAAGLGDLKESGCSEGWAEGHARQWGQQLQAPRGPGRGLVVWLGRCWCSQWDGACHVQHEADAGRCGGRIPAV